MMRKILDAPERLSQINTFRSERLARINRIFDMYMC